MITDEQKQLIEKINQLKKEKNAVILVHNYLNPEIYEIADYMGDSLGLSREAAKTDARVVLFCGVDFMAETAKILSPSKKVLISRKDATCPMAAMAGVEEVKEMKKTHPNAMVVAYVNTTAVVKAEADVCCTSANAVKIVQALPIENPIIFVPDRNLARYVQLTTARDIILWPGFCHSHHFITEQDVVKAKQKYPLAKVIAHPECSKQVLDHADEICSTEGMVKYAKESEANEFIVLTEVGMVNRLKRDIPDKHFCSPEFSNEQAGICPNMKKTTLQDVYDVLNEEKNEVVVPEEIAAKARKALNKMMELS
ncbi:quinolinate synthase NadA [Candidatus Woesearchaeota archaeon]|jgi:quinolinate synthase|nr:quinolinate synthase NadA [Candidatus Woesearchaeota archaeon]MBT5272816.1 quinolinate synthase NadA [Candidatus Woesearchaeota archaeon]MBT6040428.1 quinolinate synthase NadA [Candidatus Woesearchaeota archaeon]MBT6336939.1 quinolinate synthase NadA [Candidatus Woesearchaeota archaeon]MBT7926825.1 quinolinate synthase NadA [Candidatus Woesearchaeota archaeon]